MESKVNKVKSNKFKIVLIANSSWYLYHYRYFLIKKLRDIGGKIILIAPKDEFTNFLNFPDFL